jgi:nucleotide-binding universal stress UspA family protein
MGIRTTAVNPTGSIKREIVSLAKAHSADLVVLGTRGSKGLDRILFGSQAEDVARNMRCPVIVVGPQAKPAPAGPWTPKKLMCAVSGKTKDMKIVEYAHLLSRILGAKLRVFTVSTTYQEQVETFMGQISRELQDVDVEIVRNSANVEGEPAATIVAFARESNADLLIMEATESHHSISHFPRGMLPEVFASASCPLLALNSR